MGLANGTRLGPYEIVAPLGAGGMGEVYTARDTRLGRTVAVKILPAEFASDAKLKIRLEREARAISAINHPHICALYDVGPDYLVMEHCQGKTLAKRLIGGPLPIEQVIQYGIEIADALDKAHRAGIIHRDLKPSNIMITKSGVKLLDFGLAKQHADSSPEGSTVQAVTEEGKILGTVQYMAPELFHGKEADARSDIFALGLVLYEMTTGQPAFSGESKASLIASILEHEPKALLEIAPASPHALDRLVRACLAKDPDQRIQSAHDAKLELRWVDQARADLRPVKRPVPRWALVAALLLVALGAFLAIRRPSVKSTPQVHAEIRPPAGYVLGVTYSGPVAISPDGESIAFRVSRGRTALLCVREVASARATLFEGTEGAEFPFWSPDSRSIAFFADDRLKAVKSSGGAVRTICSAPQGRAGTWSRDGTIIIALFGGGLQAVDESGGTPRPVIRNATRPFFLPDGRSVFFNRFLNDDTSLLMVGTLDGGEPQRIGEGMLSAQLSKGHLLYVRDGNLEAREWNGRSRSPTGPPKVLAENVDAYAPRAIGNFSVTAGGQLVWVAAPAHVGLLVHLDRSGRLKATLGEFTYAGGPRLSPDGTKVALPVYATAARDRGDIWSFDMQRGTRSRIASFEAGRGYTVSAVWSPDGSEMAWATEALVNGRFAARIVSVASPERQREVFGFPLEAKLVQWSPDGKRLLLAVRDRTTRWDVASTDVAGSTPTKLIDSDADEGCPELSPDGRWIAYQANYTGKWEIYLAPFSNTARRIQVSTDGGTAPVWSRDGRQLFFLSGGKLVSVGVVLDGEPEIGRPRVMGTGGIEFAEEAGFFPFDIAPDGSIIALDVRPPEPATIHLVTDWATLLGQ